MDESDANRICIMQEMIDREDPWPDLGAPDVAFLLRIIGDLESEIDERDSRIIALQGQHEADDMAVRTMMRQRDEYKARIGAALTEWEKLRQERDDMKLAIDACAAAAKECVERSAKALTERDEMRAALADLALAVASASHPWAHDIRTSRAFETARRLALPKEGAMRKQKKGPEPKPRALQ